VTAVDTNILVYAHRKDSPSHSSALDCLRLLAEAPVPWAIPWPCVHEFLGVVKNPRIFQDSSTVAEAITQVEVWCESPSLTFIGETKAHWLYLKQIQPQMLLAQRRMTPVSQRFAVNTE
jgi:predicted nucleic acid-binding protein